MRRSDILLTKEAITRQSPNEDIFPKEDSPELPVPRRKTNTLSILRKLVRECDGNEIGSSSYGPSHGSRTEEVPDHCWVGEYLDDEEQAERSAAAMIHETRMKDYLRRKREGYPTPATANRSLSSSEISKRFPASLYGGNFDPGPRDEVADREMNELQRKERAKEQEILKMMLELENLRRDAKLRQGKDAAKVFDYDHGVSERSNYQDRYQPPASLKYDPFDVMSPDSSRQLNRQESAKYSSQVARDSVGDSSSAQHISELYRKVTKGDYNDYKLTVRRDEVSPQAKDVSHRIEKSHGRTNELFTNQSQSVDMLPRRRVLESPVEYDGLQLPKGRHDLSGSLASFGSAMSHRKEDSKLNSSQSYEDYVNEMSRKMEMKDSDTQEEETLEIEPDMSASHLRKGLPISVLNTRQPERFDQDTRSQSSPNVVSYHEAPPMKIKPTFEHFPKDSVKNDYHGSSGLAESIDDIDASTRRVPANFNDTRKVMVDDDDQRNRRRNAGSVNQSPRDVDYHSERRHVVDESHDVAFANKARKRRYHEDRRVQKPSKPAIARKRNATEYLRGYSESDEHEGEPFLHKHPLKHPKADIKGRHTQEDSSRSHHADTRHAETRDRGYERSAREFSRNVSRSPSLEYTKSMPKPMDHIKTANISATRYSEDRESANVRRVSEICTSPSEPVMFRRGTLDKSGGLDLDTAKRDEYIDQYFDRQIKIRTGAWQDDRSVERPRRKTQGAWAEEVDRYVNKLAGQEKSYMSDEEGRFEDKAGKYSRGRDSSYNPKRDYRRGGKSHTRSPSPSNCSVRSLSGARGSSGRDERRFERRSPGGDSRERRYSPGRFVATEIPRAVPDHRELDRRTVVQPDRKLLKRATRSPSPVPLMPPGWLALVKSRNLDADGSRDQVDDIVPRKVVDRDRPLPAKRNKDLRKDLKIVLTTEMARTRVEIDEKTNQSRPQTRNLEEKAKDHALKSSATGSSKSTVHLDRNRVILNSSKVSSVRKYPAISFNVSKKGSNDKSLSSADGLTKSNAGNTPEAVSMSQTSACVETQLKLGSPANVAAGLPAESKKGDATGNSMSGNTADSAKKLALTSSKTKVSELQKKPTIRGKATSSKTKVSDLQKNLTSKKLALTSSKTKASDLQQNPTSKRLALTSSKTKVSELQKKPTTGANAMSSSEKDVMRNAAKSFRNVLSHKSNVTVNKATIDASKDQSKKSGQATSASASADSLCQHWMQRYKTWFSTVLEPVLSKDEQVASLGWRDPIRFLNCVTTGNKRAMSHIPRGERAIEMLRFIALNRNESDASGGAKNPEGSSEDNARSATVVKKQASAAETQQKNKGKDARVNEGPINNVVPKVPKDKPVSLHAKRDLTASKEKFGNVIKNQKEKVPDSISGSGDKDDSVTVSISRPKSNRHTSKTPEIVRKEDRDVTTQKDVPIRGANPREDKCPAEQDPTNVSDSNKKQQESTIRQPHVAKKKPLAMAKPNSAAKSKQPQRPQSKSPADATMTSNAVNKSQSKQRSRSTQENESKQLDGKPKSQSTERRKSVTTPSRSTVEPKHAKNAPSKSRQHTSKSKDRKPDVKWPGNRKRRSDSNQSDRSDEKIIIPSEEPILSAAQKDVLPAFKKRVERTTVRQLNVLYSIDKYDKANVISAAKDSLSAFKLSNGGSQGFSTKHALYYMSALFKYPPSDSADDVNRQYRKYDLDGPKFELSLRNFHLFQNVVLALCKDRLDPNRIAMSQDQIKRSFVRQQAEFLFPQFCNEADALIKLWCWHERMKIVLDNESLARMHSKLQPFPDNHGQSLENTIAQWTKSVIVGPLYNQIDSFSYSVVSAIKTELMKRRPHVSRQEAIKILLQSWIRNHFEDIERRRKPAKETVIEPVEDSPESELMVLDEVYSDESEDENEFDITDDSESVQIDLF